jgi:hypothetical protein
MHMKPTEQHRAIEVGPPRSAIGFSGHWRCSDCVPPWPSQNVLLVGAERPDEFRDALRLIRRGHDVMVVNPRETAASGEFQRLGGSFVGTRIEELPLACRCFDLICENYPYPSGEHYVPPGAFALARLSRLACGGRWILFTEAARFATLLKMVVEHDVAPQGRFSVAMSSVSPHEAPPSAYPRAESRFRLIFERRR